MLAPEIVKAKVCLVGEASVGKSSLAHRFVYGTYDGRYVPTLAARVSKKEIPLRFRGRDVTVVLTIWDVMGESTFLKLLEDAWFSRVQGILAVGDTSRPFTFPALKPWLESARKVSGKVPVLLLANKVDLPESEVAAAAAFAEAEGLWWARTSAKSGKNVEAAFVTLAASIVRNTLASSTSPELRELAALVA